LIAVHELSAEPMDAMLDFFERHSSGGGDSLLRMRERRPIIATAHAGGLDSEATDGHAHQYRHHSHSHSLGEVHPQQQKSEQHANGR
jgi:phosphoglycerate dehydrogenase-like enzyme